MGVRDKVQTKVAKAFDGKLADAVRSFSCIKEGPGEYDPETGGYTPTVTGYQGRGVFGGYSVSETDGTNILITDTKLTVLQSELIKVDADGPTGELVEPGVDDILTGNGLEYRVVDWGQDPASASFTIQLRAS